MANDKFRLFFKKNNIHLNKFSFFIIVSSIMIVIILDSNFLMGFLSEKSFPLNYKLTLFLIFVCIFIISGIILLIWTYKITFIKDANFNKRRISFILILIIYCILCLTLIITYIQIVLSNSYSNKAFYISAYVSLLSSLGFLSLLSLKFYQWYLKGKNKFTLFFGILFSLYSISLILALIYLINGLATHPSEITYTSPRELRAGTYSINIVFQNNIAILYDFFFIISFLLAWTLTVFMLKQYTIRIGKSKFWILVSLPLLFYLLRYEGILLNYFNFDQFLSLPSMGVTYPNVGIAIYTAFMNSNIQTSGIFFGLSFLAIFLKLKNSQLRNDMMITIIGMIILFASRDFHSIFLNSLPPNGIITISFMVLGAYMLYTGIISFLQLAVRDKEFYKDLMNRIETDTELLKDIIITEKEKELAKKIKPLMDYHHQWEKTHHFQTMKFEEANEIIKDIISEFRRRNINSSPDSYKSDGSKN